MMWCGVSVSTWFHETVRHTWRFDFDSSNSFSVVFVICSLKYVEQKRKCVSFVLFLCFFCFRASQPCSTLFRGLVLFCVFLFLFPFFSPGVVCFISQAIWLVSESNFAVVSPCAPLPPPPLLADVLTFTHFPKLTRCLHTPNKSILHLPHLEHQTEMRQLIAALKTCRLLLMFLDHYGSGRPKSDPRASVCVFVRCRQLVCVARAEQRWEQTVGGGFGLAAAPQVRTRALSPLVYLTQLCPLCSLFPLLCLIN